MIASKLWPVLLMAAATQAATLPLVSGRYVLASLPCKDPPFAAMFDYDGHRFSYPHASSCRSTVVTRQGSVYRFRETCTALGDGSATASFTAFTVYKIVSPERVTLRRGRGDGAYPYRRCLPPRFKSGV